MGNATAMGRRRDSVARRAVTGVLYTSATSYLRGLVRFGATVALARLLAPDDFGIVALALFFLSLFKRVEEFGFDYALIHRTGPVESALSVHLILKVGLSLGTLALAVGFGLLWGSRLDLRLPALLGTLAAVNVVSAASATRRVWLEKQLAYRPLAAIGLISIVAWAVVAIGMAVMDWGYWSLAGGMAAETVACFVGLWWLCPWRIPWRIELSELRWFLRFGGHMWFAGTLYFVVFRFQDLLIGVMRGTAQLGYFGKAFELAGLPTVAVTNAVSRVSLSAYSKLQADRGKLTLAFQTMASMLVRLATLAALLIFVAADEVVLVLLGEKWLPSVPLLRLLVLYSLSRPLFDDAGSLFSAVGRPELLWRIYGLQAAAILAIMPVAVWSFGPEGAGVVLGLVLAAGLGGMYRMALEFVDVDYARVLLAPVLAGVVGLLLCATGVSLWMPEHVAAALVVKGVGLVSAYGAVLAILERRSLRRGIRTALHLIRGEQGVT